MLIDVTFFIVMILAIFKGFRKGLILGIFSFLAFLIGLAAALKLSVIVAHYLEDASGSTGKWLPVLSFLLVFIAVVLLVNVGAAIIKKAISLAMLGWIDRLGGIVLYMVIYTTIFSVLLFFGIKTNFIGLQTVEESRSYPFIAPFGPFFIDNIGKILPVFKGLFTELQYFFEKLGSTFAK